MGCDRKVNLFHRPLDPRKTVKSELPLPPLDLTDKSFGGFALAAAGKNNVIMTGGTMCDQKTCIQTFSNQAFLLNVAT